MNDKIKNIVLVSVMCLFFGFFAIFCIVKAPDEYSESERRVLPKFPELTFETVFSGKFMSEFETYSTDQFPFRDEFRGIKAGVALGLFRNMDNNDIFFADGHISKLEYPLKDHMLEHASDRFHNIYNTLLKDTDVNILFGIVPDKNYYIGDKNGYLTIDYDKLFAEMQNKIDFADDFIDLRPLLSAEDFYTTDSHWKQQNIYKIAEAIAKKFGTKLNDDFNVQTLDVPFYGVYAGQSALPVKPDTLQYLTSDILDKCTVNYYGTGKPVEGDIYNLDKGHGKDPYELFLSGSEPLIVIENPSAETKKELVVFRDSYSSSLVPLLVSGYSKITVIDIRYMQSNVISSFVEFNSQDVLFLYSSTILNNSLALR